MTKSFEPRSVVCAVDLAEPFDELVATATSIAARFRAHLILLHVWSPWVPTGPEAAFVPLGEPIEVMSIDLRRLLDNAVRTARQTYEHVDGSLVPGGVQAWDQILLFADTTPCDLIIAGTHGRTGLARLMHRSVAERVVRGSNVPVLVVPTQSESEMRADSSSESERVAQESENSAALSPER